MWAEEVARSFLPRFRLIREVEQECPRNYPLRDVGARRLARFRIIFLPPVFVQVMVTSPGIICSGDVVDNNAARFSLLFLLRSSCE